METAEAQDLSGTHSFTSGTEKDEPSTVLLNTSSSLGSSPAICGSAVSALQSKVREVSQRKLRGKEKDDLLSEVCTEKTVKDKQDIEGWSPQTEKSSAGDDELPEPKFQVQTAPPNCVMQGERDNCIKSVTQGVAATSRGLCEGSSLENIAVGGVGELHGDTTSTKSTTSSPRHWAPPKGFWKVARPETLQLNSESSLTKDVPPKNEEDLKQKPKLKIVDAVVHKELQRSDSLESAFHRCLQRETGTTDPVGGLWKADSWETVCFRGGALSLADKVEMNRTYLNQYQVKAIEITTSMRPEGQYKPPMEPNQGRTQQVHLLENVN